MVFSQKDPKRYLSKRKIYENIINLQVSIDLVHLSRGSYYKYEFGSSMAKIINN